MTILKGLATLTATCLVATSAWAADPQLPAEGDVFVPFGHVGDWYVFVDQSRGTCMTEKTDPAGHVVQIGLTKDNTQSYLAVYALIPEDLRDKSETLTVSVAGQTHTGKISRWQRHNAGAYSGGYILSDNFDLFAKAADVTEVVAFPDQSMQVNISLTGSAKAIELAKECTAAQP